MTAAPRPLVAGNWKMNGLKASLGELAAMARLYDSALRAKVDLLICPPATLSALAAHTALGSHIAVGAQDCHAKASGAHTGDLSAEMFADAGLSHIIAGHSERRADHGESDAVVKAKALAAIRAGLTAIVCVGETEAERRGGQALAVVGRQLEGSLPPDVSAAQIIIAYEPVWAIGTGLTPTAADVAEVHGFVRERLVSLMGAAGKGVRILYGGSVKPGNAKELMGVPNVNGALVGGASLTAGDFIGIARAYV